LTLATCACGCFEVGRRVQLIRELKLEDINHIGKNPCMCQKAHITERPSNHKKRWLPLEKSDQSQEKYILK
jgi:hypothetical protein